MPDEARSIFRHEALWQTAQGTHRTVLPRLIQPRTFLCLWILIALMAVAAVLAFMAEAPVFTAGTAAIVESNGDTTLALILPAASRDSLQVGQTAWINWPAAADPTAVSIAAIEDAVLSPSDLRLRFALPLETVSGPSVLAFADGVNPFAEAGQLSPESYRGSTAPVRVHTGSRSLLSLFTDAADPD
jgi:hypothetical protein